MNKLLSLLIPLSMAVDVCTSKVQVDGIYYNLNNEYKTAEVTCVTTMHGLGLGYVGSITIPATISYNDINYSVNSIDEQAFCTDAIISVDIPNSVKYIGEKAFAGCSSLTSIVIPYGVICIDYSVFEGCSRLTSIEIPNSVTSIKGFAFLDCTGLTSLEIPNSVTDIGYSAFERCTSLTSIEIPNSLTIIEQDAFKDCSGLTKIIIPNSVTIIGEGAFMGCSSLQQLIIPNSVKGIGDYAFEDCTSLTKLTISNSVTRIGSGAFEDCTGLTSIISKGEIPANLGWDVYGDGRFYESSESVFKNVDKSNCILYVPVGCKSVYEGADGWKEFHNIVEEEPNTDISALTNAIYVDQVNGLVGGTMDIPVKMKSDFAVRGFQFTMELPEGVTINSWQVNPDRLPSGISASKVLPMERIEGNRIVATCVLNDGNKTFTGNEGVIATVNVTFGSDMEAGLYPIYLTEASISDATSANQKVLSDVKATLVLDDYVVGDTNGDGKVLVGDVISILNYIVGERPEGFNVKAADVNSDGKILVGDVIAVLNIIVGL